MKKLVRVAFILLVLVISGCKQDAPKLQKYDPQTHYVQTQATVVVKLNDLSYMDLTRLHKVVISPDNVRPVTDPNASLSADPNIREQQEMRLDLRSLFGSSPSPVEPTVSNEYRVLRNTQSFIPYSYSESIYTIAPGVYYISFLEYQDGNNLHYTVAPGLSSQGTFNYGAFDIKPGQVLYLGDISCTWKGRNQIKKISIADNLAEVKQNLLAAGYKNIADTIVTATFYPSGIKAAAFKCCD